jgi:sugar/nucleoside kinase (ribokinase family)
MSVRSIVVLNDFCHVQGGASGVAVNEAVALGEAGLDVTFIGAVGPICEELRAAPVKVVNAGLNP